MNANLRRFASTAIFCTDKCGLYLDSLGMSVLLALFVVGMANCLFGCRILKNAALVLVSGKNVLILQSILL